MAPPPSTAHVRPASMTLPEQHAVQFYESEEFLHSAVANFLAGGLQAGEPVIVIATEPHRRAFTALLAAKGIDVESLCASGLLVLLDARDTLNSISTAGEPDWELFRGRIGGLVEEKRARSRSTLVRAYGE